jgi:uncharacterized protein (TIGR01319 family)
VKLLSIDIGSTWTKGALFEIGQGSLKCGVRCAVPTTVDDLARGFFAVAENLAGGTIVDQVREGRLELAYSSSAKGGLAVAALGLVPEVTLETAKLAAYSAGARLTQVLSYRLTRSDIEELQRNPPDILLFAGGTDGGNTDYVLANAQALSASSIDCAIVYAGNRSVADEVGDLLRGKNFLSVANVLPDMSNPNPDPARSAIRGVFLEQIVKGKGLDTIVEATGAQPLPTPYAMFEYAKAIREHVNGWEEFVLLDMGGATTDVYSAHEENPAPGTVLRSLPEPVVKRTVEGDLGMRVSAVSAAQAAAPLLPAMGLDASDAETLAAYAARVTLAPDTLPPNAEEKRLDSLLAGACVTQACIRHAGRASMVYTPDGDVRVQTGRDLSAVPRVIGSGGWLARAGQFKPSAWLSQFRIDEKRRAVLMPGRFEYWRDEAYLFPLLANAARLHPRAAALAGIGALTRSE